MTKKKYMTDDTNYESGIMNQEEERNTTESGILNQAGEKEEDSTEADREKEEREAFEDLKARMTRSS